MKEPIPKDYDDFANDQIDEEAFNRIFGEEVKVDTSELVKDKTNPLTQR